MASISELEALGINKVLVPIDGSETSFRTAKYALPLAKAFGASVTLLYVTSKLNKQVQDSTEEWFNKIKDYPEASDVEIKGRVIESATPIEGVILETASKEGTNLIVISPKSIGTEVKLGSVTAAVCTSAPCSVLVVR